MELPSKGRIVLVRVKHRGDFDDGLRTAIVTGVHRRGVSVTVFPDPASDPDQPPGRGPTLHRRDLKYGDGVWQWRWPQDEKHEAAMAMQSEPAAQEPDEPEEPATSDGEPDEPLGKDTRID